MLVQYSVENFRSIKDEIIINFSADKKQKYPKWVIEEEGVPRIYKSIGLVGPNASGKTNIIQSFLFALRFIQGTIKRKESAKINIETYAFGKKDESEEDIASFEFIFIYNKVKYVYGFSVNSEEVVEEYLMGYFSAKPKTLFDRKKGQQYDFKGNDVSTQTEIARKTNRNRLYMPVAAEWGYERVKAAYEWFNFISRQYLEFDISKMLESIIKDKKKKGILLEELRKADFNIRDIYVENKKWDRRSMDFLELLVNKFASEMDEVDIPDFNPIIHVVHENMQGELFDIRLEEDSAGTSAVIQNIVELLYIGSQGGLILEDELGKTYHTKLTQHFLNMVKSDRMNQGNTQLLFSSHDTKILNILNPDQIYLVDKDEEGATFVKLLDDFVIRAQDNIELGYLKGRYGSIPYMKG